MKVSRIEIKDYQQFKDFTLDLTYPKGHELEGQPLKKVCFIGQSGTGKTTILNVISDLINNLSFTKSDIASSLKKLNLKESTEINLNFQYEEFSKKSRIGSITLKNGKYEQDKILNLNSNLLEFIEEYVNIIAKIAEEYIEIKKRIQVIYLETGLEKQIKLLLEKTNTDDLVAKTKKQKDEELLWKFKNESYKITKIIKSDYDFQFSLFKYFLLNPLDEYDRKYGDYLQELPKQFKNKNASKVAEELQNWSMENPNPRTEIAKLINDKLKYFNLKIDEEWAKGGILIKNLQNEEIPLHELSTGTKQILLTAIILYLLETKDKIILFDEPENSLYPDIQRTLINYYTDLAPEAQFFFATHSPMIASQFEPWEIVELEFDTETGFVQRKNYYEGENHVDNYTIYPQYLRWDDILHLMFDVEEDGDSERKKMLYELTRLEGSIKRLKKEKADEQEIIKEWNIYKEIADKLNWRISNEKN